VANEWCKSGRERVLLEEEIQNIIDYLSKHPKKSISEALVALDIDASRPSINKALLRSGFRAYRAPKKF